MNIFITCNISDTDISVIFNSDFNLFHNHLNIGDIGSINDFI